MTTRATLRTVNVSVLEREIYTEAEAARLLRVPQGTLHYGLRAEAGADARTRQ